jgi:hypothetical protein
MSSPNPVTRQQLDINVPAAMNTHATSEELLDAMFLCGPYPSDTQYEVKSYQAVSCSQNFFFNFIFARN